MKIWILSHQYMINSIKNLIWISYIFAIDNKINSKTWQISWFSIIPSSPMMDHQTVALLSKSIKKCMINLMTLLSSMSGILIKTIYHRHARVHKSGSNSKKNLGNVRKISQRNWLRNQELKKKQLISYF